MAGIISNVDDDVQKLRKLKNEIENVKKALKGINITVDIDIAKGLQSQLTSLLSQYDALVDKVAVAEGKIMLSTKRINDAAEKIIKAQEKISKSVGVPAQTGNVNVQANTAETASIQAQAKAYDDLKAEIDGILGARDANVKRMVDEMNAIRLINAEIKKITKLQGDASLLSSAQQKRLEQLNNSLLTHKAALSDVRQTLNNNVRLDNASATSMNGISQSLSRMRVAYRELTEEERNSPFGKELLASINQADIKIKELDATIGNHQRNVGNYGKQWDGLSMSIQQVGRELPSLAYGPKVFFSAISNNIPILADEIKRARTEYELLKKSGQAATPVWKQVVSSLFSWQSALTVGITLLTLYGDKVVDWVAGLSKAKEAIKELLSAEQEMALARKKAISDSTKERAELDLLYNKLKGTSLSTKERTAAVNEWMKKYPQHSNIMNGELVSLGKLESAYQSLSKQIIESAKARSYSDRITELESKRFDANFKRLNQKKSLGIAESEYLRTKEIYEKLQKDYDSGKSVGQALSTTRVSYMNAKEEYEKQKEIYANLEKETNDYASKINYIAEQIKVDDLYPQPEEGTHDYWQQQVQIADVALKQIDSKQKALLDNAVKDPKKDLYGLGIDKYIVDSYKQAIKLKTEAEKELKVYDSSSKQENQADKLRKEQEKLNEQLLSLRRKNQQDEINLMEDGTEKKLRQINLDYQKETDAIKKQRKEWEDAQGGKMTEEQTLVIDLRKELAGKKKDSDTSKVHEEEVKEYQKLLSSYQDYLTKRKNAEDKFNADRKKLKDGGASDAQINELEYQRDETLKSIDNEFAMREDSFKAWTDNITNLSLEKLREMLVQAEQELQRSEFLNPNDKGLATQRAKVTSLKNTINEKTEKTNTSPNKRSQKEWQDLYKTLSKVEKEFDEIGTTVGDTAGEIISAAGSIASSTLQMIDGITTLANSSSDAMAGTAQAASKSIQAVEKASVILAIVGAALQITTKMFDLFGGDTTTEKYEEAKEAYQSYINILDKVIDKQLELAESLSGDNAQAAYDRAIELVKTQSEAARVLGKQYLNSGSSWKSHSKGYKEVDNMSAAGWADAAKALGMSVSQFKKAMGGRMTGLFDLTDEQLAKLQEEAHIFWAQLDSDTQNYANQIAEGVAQVKEVLEQQMTDTTLIDVDTLRNDFHELLTDMDADSADFADNFEDYMRNAILNSMLKESYMGRLEEWRKKFYAAMDDGVDEQEYNDLKKEGQQIADEMKAQRDAMADMFGWESESTSQSSTSKGFQAMSQDTGEELNGRFTALQIAGEEIKTQNIAQTQSLNLLTARADAILSMNTETRNIADDTRDLIANSYLELVQISENTGNSAKYLKDIKADIAEVKKNTSKL